MDLVGRLGGEAFSTSVVSYDDIMSSYWTICCQKQVVMYMYTDLDVHVHQINAINTKT